MSKYFKTLALVLRSRPLGERDRLLSLFTLERGKLSAVAPGARKMKSKLAAGVELFTCGSFLLYRGRSLATVTQLEIDTSFKNIQENIKDYAYGMYCCELVEKLCLEGEANPQLFKLLYDIWGFLDQGQADRDLLARYFELGILTLLGYEPHFKNCLHCGETTPPFFWSNAVGGLICSNCSSFGKGAYPLSSGTRVLADSLMNCSPLKLAKLRAPDNQKKELMDILQLFMKYWTGIEHFQTLDFLEEINKKDNKIDKDKKIKRIPE